MELMEFVIFVHGVFFGGFCMFLWATRKEPKLESEIEFLRKKLCDKFEKDLFKGR